MSRSVGSRFAKHWQVRSAFWLLLGLVTTACGSDEPPGVKVVRPPDDKDAGPEEDGGPRSHVCGDVDCGLHGDCVLSPSGAASCTCDEGYIATPGDPGPDGGICVEDLSCVTARIQSCRTGVNTSSIGMHFSLQYCSGKPYTGLADDQIILEEKGLGNDDYIELLQEESFVGIIPSDPLNHIYVVVDVSNSIQQSDVLGDLAGALQLLIDELEGMGGQYRFSVFLFDGRSYLYNFILDTDDLLGARTALDGLEGQVGEDPSSSNVFGAVINGINRLERAMDLRTLVSDLGILSTGTLIVVSDGDDRSSARTLDEVTAKIDKTAINILTVGLGDEANYPTLTSIGRDGSFSAPTGTLIKQTFRQIAARIRDQRDSLYLVGYCSPKRMGDFSTRVGIRDLELGRPSCTFNASAFIGGTCTQDNLKRDIECGAIECGGVIGCGGCPDGQCCDNGTCMAPTTLPETARCGGEWMCSPGNTCLGDICDTTVPGASPCTGAKGAACDLGEFHCDSPSDPMDVPQLAKECLAALGLGEVCRKGSECQSLTCAVPPSEPGSPVTVCLPPARMYEPCEAGKVACEPGSWCNKANVCDRQANGGSCETNAECKSGNCVELSNKDKVCYGPDMSGAACLFSLAL